MSTPTVTIGGTSCSGVTFNSSTSLSCTSPSHAAGIVDVVVTNPDSTVGTYFGGYQYNPAPTLTTVSPTAGTIFGLNTLTVNGTGFEGGIVVTVGGNSCPVTTLTSTQLQCTLASHSAATVNVVVTNTDGQTVTLTSAYTYQPAPTVTSVSPVGGPPGGGTSITITGTGFLSGATAALSGANCGGLTVVNSTTITCTTGASSSGNKTMTVHNTDGQSGSLAGAFQYNSAPTLSAVSPVSGALAGGTAITLTGTNFVAGASVTVGGNPASSVVVVNATTITCNTPSHSAGLVDVIVTSDVQSATLSSSYTYEAAPTISSVVPVGGPLAGGTAITITGTGFLSGAAVTVGGTSCSGISVVSSTSITCTTPSGSAGAQDVVVTNTDTQAGTSVGGFTYEAAPTLSAISPTAGALGGGTLVTLTGTNFLSGASVTIGAVNCIGVSVLSGTSATCTTGSHSAGATNVVFSNADSQSATLVAGYLYEAGPTFTSVSPTAGPLAGGTNITITGSNFLGSPTVNLGGASCTVSSSNATQIFCQTTTHVAGATNLVITNPDGQTATGTGAYTYQAAPTVTSVTPIGGTPSGGTSVTVTGTGFVSGASVTFGVTPATGVTVVNSTSITATTPAGAAGAVNVTVANSDGQSGVGTNVYTYENPPTLSAISPTAGALAGGTAVTLTGTGFLTGAIVSIGGSLCNSLTVVSATQITCTTSSHAAATVGVTVTNLDTQAVTLAASYTYEASPNVTSISPTAGPLAGGTAMTITGTGFLSAATVTIGGNPCTSVVVVNSTSITCNNASHAAATVDVTVTNTDTQASTLSSSYAYQAAPTVTSVSPSAGSTGGSTLITITGTGFVTGATATVGGNNCTGPSVTNSTTMTCTTASHSAATVDVIVSNLDGQSGTGVGAYIFRPAPTVTAVSPLAGNTGGGTAVTVTGTGFVAGAGITFGVGAGTGVTVVNSTTITATTPSHSAGAVNVVVTNVEGQLGTDTNGFTYSSNAAPTISALSPIGGDTAGGTFLTITGTGFVAGATVKIGASSCTGVSVVSSSSITCNTPLGPRDRSASRSPIWITKLLPTIATNTTRPRPSSLSLRQLAQRWEVPS